MVVLILELEVPLYLLCTSLYWMYDGMNQILYVVVDSEGLLEKKMEEVDSIVEEHDYLFLLLDHVNNLDDDPCIDVDVEEDLLCCY